jgi:CubicO group peptidase (beta-lactamase class C family)
MKVDPAGAGLDERRLERITDHLQHRYIDGMGFGLTVAVAKAPAATQVIGSPGEYMWGGVASTIFWADPAETSLWCS